MDFEGGETIHQQDIWLASPTTTEKLVQSRKNWLAETSRGSTAPAHSGPSLPQPHCDRQLRKSGSTSGNCRMTHGAFAVAVASSTVRAPCVRDATLLTNAAPFRPPTVATYREAPRLVSYDFPLHCGGGGGFTGGKGGGDSGNLGPDRTPDGNGRDGLSADDALIPFMDKLLRGSSAAAALAGYSVASLLEERNPSALNSLSASDFKDAGLVGLFGCLVYGAGGSLFYQMLDEFVSGSTLVPVAIKTCIDALLFLPLVAETFDRFAKFASSSDAPDFLRYMQGREHSSVHLLRKRAFWVPAQAVSFWFLPPWWRVGYVSIIMSNPRDGMPSAPSVWRRSWLTHHEFYRTHNVWIECGAAGWQSGTATSLITIASAGAGVFIELSSLGT